MGVIGIPGVSKARAGGRAEGKGKAGGTGGGGGRRVKKFVAVGYGRAGEGGRGRR